MASVTPDLSSNRPVDGTSAAPGSDGRPLDEVSHLDAVQRSPGFAGWLRQARAISRGAGVSILAQVCGILYFWARIGTRRREYYLYRLYDRNVPLADRLTTLSASRWYGMVNKINPLKYQYLVDDKTTFAALLAQFGIPTAQVYDVFDTSSRRFATGAAAEDGHSFAWHLLAYADRGLVIKDEWGAQGRFVFVVKRISSSTFTLASQEMTADAFYGLLVSSGVRRFMIQRRLFPAPLLKPLSFNTVLTVRVVTYLADGVSPSVLRASIRIPRDDRGVDNFSAGNLAAPVQTETGILGLARERDRGEWHRVHPTTGAPIEGFCVPEWESVIALVKRAAVAMSRLSTIGWDVALTDEGPVLIEGNSRYNFNVIQLPQNQGLWKGDFRDWCESVIARRTERGRTA